jgi:hypothetical protein
MRPLKDRTASVIVRKLRYLRRVNERTYGEVSEWQVERHDRRSSEISQLDGELARRMARKNHPAETRDYHLHRDNITDWYDG